MKLQALIDQTELELSQDQVKAFFLGALMAQKPLPFPAALDEILSEAPSAKAELEAPLKELWEKLKNRENHELENLFSSSEPDVRESVTSAQEKLDYFLTGLSLAGTSSEDAEGEFGDVLEELEDILMEMDEWLADASSARERGDELKELLLESWERLVEAAK